MVTEDWWCGRGDSGKRNEKKGERKETGHVLTHDTHTRVTSGHREQNKHWR